MASYPETPIQQRRVERLAPATLAQIHLSLQAQHMGDLTSSLSWQHPGATIQDLRRTPATRDKHIATATMGKLDLTTLHLRRPRLHSSLGSEVYVSGTTPNLTIAGCCSLTSSVNPKVPINLPFQVPMIQSQTILSRIRRLRWAD